MGHVTTAVLRTAAGQSAQALMEAFVVDLQSQGVRVGGLVQRSQRDDDGTMTGMELLDIESGTVLPIDQKLGRAAACAIDTQAMAAASQCVRRAVQDKADLVVVNKFGHLEAAGGGLADEIMLAMAEGRPLLISVGERYWDAWEKFCGGACQSVALDEVSLLAWWAGT